MGDEDSLSCTHHVNHVTSESLNVDAKERTKTMSTEIEKIVGPRVPAEEFKQHRLRYLIPTLLFTAAAILLVISIYPALVAAEAGRTPVPQGSVCHRLCQPDDGRCQRNRWLEPLHRHAPVGRSGGVRALLLCLGSSHWQG